MEQLSKQQEDVTRSQTVALRKKKTELSKWKSMLAKGFVEEDEFLDQRKDLEIEIARIHRHVHEVRDIPTINNQLKNSLQFAATASRRFLDGTPEQKRHILHGFGYDHRFSDGIYTMHSHQWMQRVRSLSEKMETYNKNARTPKNGSVSTRNAHSSVACPVMWTLVNEVWNLYLQSPESYVNDPEPIDLI